MFKIMKIIRHPVGNQGGEKEIFSFDTLKAAETKLKEMKKNHPNVGYRIIEI